MEKNKNSGTIQPSIWLDGFWADDPLGAAPRIHAAHSDLRTPKIDMEDRNDAIVVRAEMPGVEKKEIKLHVEKDSVSISAGRSYEHKTKGRNYYAQERSSFGYCRSFALPEEVKSDSARARYKNGILVLEMKKATPGQKGKDIEFD